MTKVQIRFTLDRPLDENLLRRVADAHSIYGMSRVVPTPALDGLIVDYDATRLSPGNVESQLRRLGLPVRPWQSDSGTAST
jgi:hypothetical protein